MDQEMVPKTVVDALLQQISMLQETVSALQATIEKLNSVIEEKNLTIQNQNRNRFGQNSEKQAYVFQSGQMCMFEQTHDGNDETLKTSDSKQNVSGVHVAAHTRKPKRTLEEFCADLPVEEVICDLPKDQQFNEYGEPLKCIGKEFVRSELRREKARVWVAKIYTNTYADPHAEERTGKADIQKSETPSPLLPHSYASASVVTDIMIRKFADAMPLYRQEQSWKREFHLELKRSTMANWVISVADIYLRPFWNIFQRVLLSQHVIHADETVLQVLDEPGRKATQESRMWVYASAKRTEQQIRLFQYEASRAGACAETMLKGFGGVLISDGYSGYNLVGNVTRAGCWAHARRKWREAMPAGATPENSKAAKGFEYCTRLFEAERKLENLSAEERLRARQGEPKTIVEEYYTWLGTLFNPSGKLRTAIIYSQNQKEYLCAFLKHGEIEISNNQVENAIRPLVVGRKNWLFSATPDGANASATAYSFMETAKANGLNVESYLMHILKILPDRFAKDPNASVNDLLPWTDEMKTQFSAT